VFVAALAVLPSIPLSAEQNRIDSSPTLFSVLAALQAAEHPFVKSAPADPDLRKLVQAHLDNRKIAVLPELRNFIKTHAKPSASADLAQYVSFALAVTEAPEFKIRFQRLEIPPDVEPLEGFEPLMVRFYRDAGIEDLWRKVRPFHEVAMGRLHSTIVAQLNEANGYLRNPTSGYMGRQFIVLIDLLGPRSQVHSRSYGDDYFFLLSAPPSAKEAPAEEIRHAYFHYLLDPLSIKYSEQINKKRALIDYAQAAPALAPDYKADFLLLVTESLIKAIEARLYRGGADERQDRVKQALEEGYILTPYFAEQLPFYEKQETAMRLYLPDLVSAVDVKKEGKRLEAFQFRATPAEGKIVTAGRTPDLTPAQQALLDGEKQADDKSYDRAKSSFLRVLQASDEKTLHSKAYFGLGRIAVLQKDPESAEKLFQKALDSQPEPSTASWARYYLGRLAELSGNSGQASEHFQAVLDQKGASPAAQREAGKALAALKKESGASSPKNE
jgi:tetratricopeptide (TPR) repeat protein